MKLKHFDLAKKLSYKSDHHTFAIGCVLARGNKVVGVGFNKLKTHPRSNHSYKMLHAEISALLGVSRDDLRGCDAYLYRETKNGMKALSRPCATCEAALREAGIERVFYTVNDTYDTMEVSDV